jgi:hypothetical protein
VCPHASHRFMLCAVATLLPAWPVHVLFTPHATLAVFAACGVGEFSTVNAGQEWHQLHVSVFMTPLVVPPALVATAR